MEWNSPSTLAGLTFNAASGNTYWNDAEACSGIDMADIRLVTAPKPQAHGIVKFPTLREAFHITIAGTILIPDGNLTSRNTLIASMKTALNALATGGPGTLTFAPQGVGAISLSVDLERKLEITGGLIKRYQFGLLGYV